MDGLENKMQRISELEDRKIASTQSEHQRENREYKTYLTFTSSKS